MTPTKIDKPFVSEQLTILFTLFELFQKEFYVHGEIFIFWILLHG